MIDWTWGRLRVLDAVARTGSVNAAARALAMTGPAISQNLRKLEVEVGKKLVERAGRGIRLTNAGTVLADHARTLAAVVQQAEADLASDDGQLRGTLRIGAISSVIRGFLGACLHEFTTENPRIRIRLEDGETVDHLRKLHENVLDVVLAESWRNQPTTLPRGLHVTQLTTERARLVLPTDHRFAARDVVPLAELGNEPWSCCPRGTDAHTALTQAARHAGTEISIAYSVADHTTQLQLAAQGLALACIPERSLPHSSDGFRIVDTDPALARTVDVVTPTGPTPLHIQRFVTALTDHIATLQQH